MSENTDQNPSKKRQLGHAIPKILENGPVILFGIRRPPMTTSGNNQSSKANPDSPSDENDGKAPSGE